MIMKFNFIYQTNQGRVTVLAETQEQADRAVNNTRKFTFARFVGKEIAKS
jgi:hypothetical protein